ncbi:MAG: ABC transporter substrate-binding protein, partial [Desulfobacterales bacterium]|nr:ABC transporter substrate-binding protein [Desulfobacterales bacterium]
MKKKTGKIVYLFLGLFGFTLIFPYFHSPAPLFAANDAKREISKQPRVDAIAPGPPRVITLQLPWLHQFQFAGYYAAVEQGYYEDAGFMVNIKEGRPGVSAVKEVVSGRANYGAARGELLLHRLRGEPIVVLAAFFQHSAIIFLTKRSSGINHPQDMVGRKVMLLEGDDAAEHIAMFLNEGVSPDQIDIIRSSYDIEDLIQGKTDVFNAYSTNEPYLLQKKDIPATIIKPITYGIDFYGDCLFTSETECKKFPDRVKLFREASIRGWEYALDHPEELIDLIKKKYGVGKARDHLRFEAEAIRKLIMPDLVEIGHMNPGRWRRMADTYVELNMAEPDYSLENFMYNPNPAPDVGWIKRALYAAGGVIFIISVGVVALMIFNKRLRWLVDERTLELSDVNRHLRHEIKEHEKAEKSLEAERNKLETVTRNIGVGLAVISKEYRTIWANKVIHDIFGDVHNKSCHLTYNQREEICPGCGVREIFTKGKDLATHEQVGKDALGNTIWSEIVATPIRDEDGNISSALEVVVPITERKKTEEALRVSEEKLARSKRMESLGLLAGGVAHDLNNILSGIVSYPDLILMDLPEESPLRQPIETIKKSGKRTADVVSDLLTIARGVAMSKSVTDLNDIVKEYLNSPVHG